VGRNEFIYIKERWGEEMDKVVCIKCNWKGYRKNGLLKPCPKCKGIVVWWQKVKEYEKGFWISQKEL